jgi:hypothetical protein
VVEVSSGNRYWTTRNGGSLSTQTNPAGLSSATGTCGGQPFVELTITRNLFSGGSVSGLNASDDMAVYSYFTNPAGNYVYGGMPADAGLCNPSNNESQVFNCSLYLATTDDGRQPASYGRIQANLESKSYAATDNTTFNDIILDGGTLNCPSGGTINVARDFTYNSGTFNLNNCTVQFNGATTQNLTLNAALTFHHLSVGNGTILVETVAADNATLSGTLTNNGTIRKNKAVSGMGGSPLA